MWQVILSNGQRTIDDGSIGCWRSLRTYCLREKVAIYSMMAFGDLVDPKADEYAVYFEVMGLVGTGEILQYKCIASIRRDMNKAYVNHYCYNDSSVFRRVFSPIDTMLDEISIRHTK